MLIYGNIRDAVTILIFFFLACIILIPFLIFPIVNLFMFSFLRPYHKFILGITGISGDALTYDLIVFIATIYTIGSFFIYGSSIFLMFLNRKIRNDPNFQAMMKKQHRKMVQMASKISLIKYKE